MSDDTANQLPIPNDIDKLIRDDEDNKIRASTTSIVRSAFPEDADAIAALTVAAFSESEYGDNGEAELIALIRKNCVNHISLVAEKDNKVCGHVLFSRTHIRTADSQVAGMALAPMAVAPDCQRSGIGSQLVETVLNQLDMAGCPFVVVVGHPNYYSRFGFKPAKEYSITHGFVGIPQDVFFIRWNEETTIPAIHGGKAWFNAAFGTQHT